MSHSEATVLRLGKLTSQRETEAPRDESLRAVARLLFVSVGCSYLGAQEKRRGKEDRYVPDTARSTCNQDDFILEFFRHAVCEVCKRQVAILIRTENKLWVILAPMHRRGRHGDGCGDGSLG